MAHYRSNLRDLEFALFEVFGCDAALGREPYAELDRATAHAMLVEVDRLAREDLAPSLPLSDLDPPVLDPVTHAVTVPEAFRRSYRAYRDGGWQAIDLPAQLGGRPLPPTLRWAIAELVLGSNPAVHLYSSGTMSARVVHELGTEEQRRWAQLWADRGWASTMVLTEAGAGSDVGAGRTSAVRQPDGSWHLTGVKRFITSGDHDLEENIVHLVLARPVGEPDAGGSGSKGLSLFLVPKRLVDWETGELGEPNGIVATRLEHKMGLRASATCEMTLGLGAERGVGDDGPPRPCVGWLVGEQHHGIAQMFKVIETARMMVGTKAIATLSTAYLNALDYARVREQGPDLMRAGDGRAPRVRIIRHPDVRRSLLLQKAYSEGLRALVLHTAAVQDSIALHRAAGEDPADDEALNDLLLPLVKGYGSERALGLILAESLPCLGGSGYLRAWPLEQYVRDATIDTLYEGTTAIQAQDLFFRKIMRDRGQALARLAEDVAAFAKGDVDGSLAAERELLGRGLEDVRAIVATMAEQAQLAAAGEPERLYRTGVNARRLLMAMGDLVTCWLLLREAEVALGRLRSGEGASTLDGDDRADSLDGEDRAFYEGKVAAARFLAREVLPRLAIERSAAEAEDAAVMDLADAAF